MAVYDKETKFYWLQLKEDFFDEDAIQWLEEQQPNGKEYAYFYLKLCVKSLKSNGILIRKVGEMLIPYDNKKIAQLTNTDFDTVTIAMGLLQKIGLVKILENGEIYLTQVENLIGSKSKGAFKKQQQRDKKLKGDICPPFCPPKIEIELEKEIDIENNIEQKNVSKTSEYENEFEELWKLYPRKEGKNVALKKYIQYRKNNEATFDEVKQGILNYKKIIEINKTSTQYILHGSTFFNQKRWEDEDLKDKSNNSVVEAISQAIEQISKEKQDVMNRLLE